MMMDDSGSQDQDFSKLSIEDRIAHKNWKARLSGYEELCKLFPQYEDREFQRFSPLIKKFVVDSNAAAQEKGLAATLAYVDYCPQAGKYVENIIAGIATKCLSATRAKTKEYASDIVLMCVEIEKQDVVVEELIKALEQKTPKNVAATIAMIRKCLNQFGYKVIGLKPIVPLLPRFLEERDQNVREETKQLTIEIYRWIKDALVPQISSLKPILLQELQVEFEKCKEQKAKPERLLRSQQQRNVVENDNVDGNENNADGGDTGEAADGDEEIDPFDLLEPFDLLSKLPADFYTLIEAKKWSERKDGLEKLQQLLEANPKLITTSDYGELNKQLKKIISKDTNVVVIVLAIKCLGQLAQGLRKNFNNYAISSIPVLLEKFKEKKQNVVQALRESIDAVYMTTNLEAINEDIVQSLDNKNPSIRSETALFLARSFAKTNPHTIQKKLLKTLTTSLLKTLSDPDAVVRESSAEALGVALKAQGERNMAPFLQGLEQLKMTKIEEYRDKAEVKKFSAPPPPQQQPSSQSAGAKSANNKPKTAPVKKAARPVAKTVPKNTSSESLDDLDLPPPPQPSNAGTMKVKSKIGGTVKSRIGAGSGSGSDNQSGVKSVRSGGGIVKTASGSRLGGTIRKGSSTSNLRAGGGVSSESGSASSLANASQSASAKKSNQNDNDQQNNAGPLMNGQLKAKEQRFADEKALKVLRWNFTTPREEFYLLLREQMTAAEWQSQLITYCFHSDFKYHIKAIDMMRDFLQKNSTADNPILIANLDLILKWIALRFFDTNPSVITKALELLLIIFTICHEEYQYQLSDMEANSFLPYLVLKFGDPKDAVRNKVHDIIAKMRSIYSPSKIFNHLFTGLQSKNSRQRATCLEEIGQLIEQRGMMIFQSPNSLSMIKDLAKFIAERDNGVRNGALACIVQVYFLEGERVFKLIGSLSDKEMSLVEERIKRASKNRPPPQIASQQNQNTESPNGAVTTGLPSLSGQRVTPNGNRNGGGLMAPTDIEGVSKISSPSNLPYDIGATMTKTPSSSSSQRSSSNLLRRNQSGGNFTPPMSRLRSQLQQPTPQQSTGLKFSTPSPLQQPLTTTDNETDSEMITDNNPGLLSATESSFSSSIKNNHNQFTTDSSDVYSTDDNDDDIQQRVQNVLTLPAQSLRYDRRSINRSSPSTATIRSSTSDSQRSSDNITPLRMNGHSRVSLSNQQSSSPEMQKRFNQLFQQLGSTDLSQAIEAAEALNVAVKDLEKHRQYLDGKIDQLIILCNKQLRLFSSKHYPNQEDNTDDENIAERRERAIHLFRTITILLVKVFRSHLGKLISRDTLRELITHLLSYFAGMRNNQTIFNSTNYLISIIMSGSDATNLFAALIRMLHDYVGTPSVEQSDKYIDITMKFIWRVTKKLHEQYYQHLNIDQILYEAHLFFKSYPRPWWNNKDDLPSRTIKTLVFSIVSLKGDSILDHFTLIQNKDESELSYYVQKALRQKFDKLSSTPSKNNPMNSNTLAASMTPNGDNNLAENHNQKISPKQQQQQQQRKIPELSKDYPLRMQQINSNINGNDETIVIPIIKNRNDLQTYCNQTSKRLQINDLSYEKFNNYYQQQHQQKPRICNIEDAKRAMELAKHRYNYFRAHLNLNENNGSANSNHNDRIENRENHNNDDHHHHH